MIKRYCCICETEAEEKGILFKPSNVFAFFCLFHLYRVLKHKSSNVSIKDWIDSEKKLHNELYYLNNQI